MKKWKIAVWALVAALVFAFVLAGCEDMSVREELLKEAGAPDITGQPAANGPATVGDAAVTLTVTATSPDGGTISYQWYSITDPGQYEKEEGTPVPTATTASYNPPLDTAGIFYYYVLVTNTNNSATDKKSETAKSNFVTVVVNSLTGPKYPAIKTQPKDATERYAAEMGFSDLSVAAEVDEGSLSYQWYYSDTYSYQDGIEITSGSRATYTPELSVAFLQDLLEKDDVAVVGKHYFYCVVTNTLNGDSVSINSNIATVEITTAARAAAPEITGQPQSFIYFIDDDVVEPLRVTAASPDGGVLSYQWYSNSTASNTLGTIIPGQTAASYIPPVDTASAGGPFYYYVVVTNTNEFVSSNKTATAVSNVAILSVQVASAIPFTNTFTVNTATKYQYVRGFGGMDTAWDNVVANTIESYEKMYHPGNPNAPGDFLGDNGLGYNIMRIMIMPWNTDIDLTMRQLTQTTTGGDQPKNPDWDGTRPFYYEGVKIVNKYGGYVLASPWSPPGAWKSNGDFNGAGILRTQNYQDYADYLKRFCEHMNENDAPIYAISIQNEPNYSDSYACCTWDSTQMANFFVTVGRFTEGVPGWGGGQETEFVLTMNGETANTTSLNDGVLNNRALDNVVDLFGRHIYGSISSNLWNNNGRQGREVWMTEHNINSGNGSYEQDSTWNYVWPFMNEVDLTLRLNNENAFIWWTAKRFYSMIGDGQFSSTEDTVLPRGYGLSHFAKFAKEMYRVQLTAAGANSGNVNDTVHSANGTTAKALAFVSEDGNTISLVMFTPTGNNGTNGQNLGTVKIQLPNDFTIGSAIAMRSVGVSGTSRAVTNTTETIGSDVSNSIVLDPGRNAVYVELPAGNILSVKFTR